ncbi:hypothetical protein GBB97_01370, partial [Bifidobacterium longum]
FVSVASGHLTLLAVGQVLQRSLEPAHELPSLRGGAVCRRQTEGSPTRMTPLSRLRRQLPSERGAFIALYTDYQHQGASRVRQRHSDLQHHSGESQDEEEPTVR